MKILSYVAFSVLLLIFQSGCFSESDSNESIVQSNEPSLDVKDDYAPVPTKVIYEDAFIESNNTIESDDSESYDEEYYTANFEEINSTIEVNSFIESSSGISNYVPVLEEINSTIQTNIIVKPSSETDSYNIALVENNSTIETNSTFDTLSLENNSTIETNSTFDTLSLENNLTVDVNTTKITIAENPKVIIYTSGNIGKFVGLVSGIEYGCDGVIKSTDIEGLFNCESTPVYFSLGNISLGDIQVFTDDYLLYPQDLLNLSRGAGLHPEVTKIAILLQSLDNDANPNNGILIHKDIIKLINQEITQNTDIKTISLINLNKIIEKVIVTNLEYNASSKLRLVTLEEAQDNMLSLISTEYQSPIQP